MPTWLTRFLRWVYGLPNHGIRKCDVIVPLGYGLTTDNLLPQAEETVLLETARLSSMFPGAPIVWASSSYFFPGSKELEDGLKRESLRYKGVSFTPLSAAGITNSVTEAREIQDRLHGVSLFPRHIVVVLDWPHARSAKLIWRKVFPEADIITRSVSGGWDKTHRAVLQRSELLWFVANILRHAMILVMGLERVARIQHPTKD